MRRNMTVCNISRHQPAEKDTGQMVKRAPTPPGPVTVLIDRLHELHLDAGAPSMREISRRTQVVNHSLVHASLRGPRVPKWGNLELIVEALGGDITEFRALWKAAYLDQNGHNPRKTPVSGLDGAAADCGDSLAQAEQEARRIIEQAQREAVNMRESVKIEVSGLRAAAEKDAHRLLEDAREQGDRELGSALAEILTSTARRSQVLVDRLIGHLDRLEQSEEDPDRLAELFQLDHLATRMRRNNENLLAVVGADSTRVRREAAPLGDVLRAAQSEIEQYTRIEYGIVDRDVEVTAAAVNDVVHLVAELLDNATIFSPPVTVVAVDARRVGDRAIVQIQDHGIGMSQEQLDEANGRLANPPVLDTSVFRTMGLVVAGRLAARLGIFIELRPADKGGIVADIVLPASTLLQMGRHRQEP
jgi:signal transduction histidine kinase